MKLADILEKTIEQNASDVFIVPGSPIEAKCQGRFIAISDERVMPADSEEILTDLYEYAKRDMSQLLDLGDDDFSFSMSQLGRFRISAYKQRGSLAAVLRVVRFGLPDPVEMKIPTSVMNLADQTRGLILVTGSAGSGKSTTLACIIDRINESRAGHIITLEDPIEFVHRHKKSLVSQREVANDTQSFSNALRAALRQAPDVILLGEMRDFDTIQTAITAAETGHLVLSSLHTVGAASTIDRMIDVFPANQQAQVRTQLSMVLKAVVSQQLVPAKDGGLLPVFEVMIATPAIQTLIRDGKTHQMDNVIFSGQAQGMMTMDNELLKLYHAGKITKETAQTHAVNAENLTRKLM